MANRQVQLTAPLVCVGTSPRNLKLGNVGSHTTVLLEEYSSGR